MKGYRLKKSAYVLIFIFIFMFAFAFIYASNINFSKQEEVTDVSNDYDVEYEEYIPVVKQETVINRPYKDEKVKILKDFYDIQDDEQTQENSIIYYESTYMQNSSVAYGGVESFDVISILDGKVIKITKDDLVGNVVEIEHENNIISVYQSVNNVKVKVNDQVKQGDIIATSGTSTINKNLNSHLLFELVVNNEISNPENYFGKQLNEVSK